MEMPYTGSSIYIRKSLAFTTIMYYTLMRAF